MNYPIGLMRAHLHEWPLPKGWLLCDWSAVPRAEYPDLFEVIGTSFGGDATTFRLPPSETELVQSLMVIYAGDHKGAA